jgi:uncharacterized protein (DUF697 family)
MEPMPENWAKELLHAVVRMLEDAKGLQARVERARLLVARLPAEDDDRYAERVAEDLISGYANKAALVGGLTSLPAVLPVVGTVIAVLGGTLADVALLLKLQVEMALCLTHLYGFDIEDETERYRAILLASVGTYDVGNRHPFFTDGDSPIWSYGSQELYRMMLAVLGRLLLQAARKSFPRAVPVVGVVVGGSLNRVVTVKVGHRCMAELENRRAKDRAHSDRVIEMGHDGP